MTNGFVSVLVFKISKQHTHTTNGKRWNSSQVRLFCITHLEFHFLVRRSALRTNHPVGVVVCDICGAGTAYSNLWTSFRSAPNVPGVLNASSAVKS